MDLPRIKANVAKMAGMNAPEADIDGYIESEGVTLDQVRDYKYYATPKPPQGMLETIGEATGSIHRGLAKRGLGLIQTADDLTGNRILSPGARKASQSATAQLNREGKGTGVGGFLGEVAGDPMSWINPTTGLIRSGAIMGGSSVLSDASEVDQPGFSRGANALKGAGVGALTGGVIKGGTTLAKPIADAAVGGTNRVMAAVGSKPAAERVAYSNVAKILKSQGYKPGEVASIIDEFTAQGIDGGTLGQILGSSDLLAREKNLLQGGGQAGRVMGEKLAEQPKKIAASIIEKVKAYAQPDQTAYLYKQAAELADAPTSKGAGGVVSMGQSATQKEVPFTLNAITDDLAARADELPPNTLRRIQKIIAAAKEDGGFSAADKAKQQLDDLYKANSATTDQDIVNDVVLGYRKMLNDSLEYAGGQVYSSAKSSAKRDMAMRDVEDAVKGAQGSSVKTALNKFFGSIEKQEEFMRKLPAHLHDEFKSYLANLEKVAGRFGGSDTNLNNVTTKQMNVETGFGIDANVLNPQSMLDRLSAPISRNVRKAQAEVTFKPDASRLQNAMLNRQQKYTDSRGVQALNSIAAQQAGQAAADQQPAPVQQPVPELPANAPAESAIPQTSLFDRVIQTESNGKQSALSPKGAIGVAQIMPKTAPDAARLAGLPYDPVKLRNDPEYNAALGKAYLDHMLAKYDGDEQLALIAYNWGPGNTDMWLKSGAKTEKLPTETRNYLKSILGG